MTPKYTIAVAGLWHLGETYSVGLAELGHHVIGISDDEKIVADFSKNTPPLPEPRLAELLASNRAAGRLSYTTDFSRIRDCNVFWVTFDTPVDDNDDADLGVIWNAFEKAAPYLTDGALIVVTSQIPVGTSKEIKDFIHKKRPDLHFEYVYTPENLRLGEAMQCFFEPGRVVVGADTKEAFEEIKRIFAGLNTEMLRMSSVSAEMAKHALNSFLATSLSFINDIADICEKTGADVADIAKALRSDPRIGPKAYLSAGLGFSGGTLGRDLKILIALSKQYGVSPFVIETVFNKNAARKGLIPKRLEENLGTLSGKTIAVFGLTYKAGTRTLRRSRAIEVAEDLSKKGVALRLHDPQVEPGEIPIIQNAQFFKDPYEAAAGSDAIVIMTPWPDFRSLDFRKLVKSTREKAILFDTSNFLYDKEKDIRSAGFIYWGIGR